MITFFFFNVCAGISHDLSLGDNEANEKAIDTLLEECKFDDLKSINPNTFWNGLLDENGSLLDVIDNKKQSNKTKDDIDDVSDLGLSSVLATNANSLDRKPIRRRRDLPQQRVGHSSFSVANLHNNEYAFAKGTPKDSTSASTTQTTTSTTTTASIARSSAMSMHPIYRDHMSMANRLRPDGMASGSIDAHSQIKKEFDEIEVNEVISGPSNNAITTATSTTGGIMQVKDEPMDESIATNVDDQSMQVRQQAVPVIKTEIGNNVPVVSNTAIQRPITIQQGAQLQQQTHQQAFATNDQSFILSSRPIRRLTTNGPADGKSGKLSFLFSHLFFFISNVHIQ